MARALFKSWFIDFDPVRAKAAGRKPSGLDSVTAALFPASFETSSFGKTPKGWKVCTVPDAFEVNPTRSLSKGQIAPYLEMANMPTSSARALAWQYREFGSGMRFINGDVLIARITPCLENGKTAYVDFLDDGQTGWGSTEYIVLRSKPPLPTTCAYFLARNDDFRAHVIRNMTGTSGRQRAPAECLNKYFVVIPSEKIAQHFGEVIAPMLKVMKTNDEQSTSLVDACDALFPRLLSGDIDITATSAMK
jgi:type I restriction enzyme S subunit